MVEINYTRLLIWIGSGILFFGAISFIYHYSKQKKENEKQMPRREFANPYSYQQQNPAPQQPLQQVFPQYQQSQPLQQYPQPMQPSQASLNPEQAENFIYRQQQQQINLLMKNLQDSMNKSNELEAEIFQLKMIKEQGRNPIPIPKEEPRQEKHIKIEETKNEQEEFNENEISGTVKIKLEIPPLADTNSIEAFRILLGKYLESNLKNLKKDLKKDHLKANIEYEII